MHTSGGRVSVVLNGVAYSARGVIKLMPSNISVTPGVNQDGSAYRTVSPKNRTAELTFDRFVDINGKPLVWDENVMQQQNFGATFVEQDTNITHILTNACFSGDPQLDTSTGEVDGVGIYAEKYKSING